MRGRSYSPSPPRHYRSSKHRSPSPRGRYGGRGSNGPTSLLVRNLRHDCREPRGFGFVQYVEPADAEDAKYHMDGQILLGRELTVVFAEENRKKPKEMRQRERVRGSSYDKKRSPQRYGRSYSNTPDYYSPSPRRRDYSPSPRWRRDYSRSISPRGQSYRERSYSRTPCHSRSRSRSLEGY